MTLLAILFSLIVTSLFALFALFAVRVFKDTREDKPTH